MAPFERLMVEGGFKKDAENSLFIMISSCQRQELQAVWQEFCRFSPGSLWIAPLRPEDEMKLTVSPALTAMKWEVDYDKV